MAKKKILVSSMLLLMAGLMHAQQRYEITVKEAVDLAFKNVGSIKNAQLDYEIQDAKNKEIRGQAYPQLSGSVSANYYLKLPGILFPDATSTAVYQILKDEGVNGRNGPITNVPDPRLIQISFLQPWNLTAGATLSQLLFQPDVFVALQARRATLDYSKSLIDQTKENIKDSAYKRYYAILIAEKQLHFLNEGIVRLEKLYHDDSIMFKNGFAERLDLDKVQVQLNNLKSTRNQVANGVLLATAGLKFAIGVSQKDTVILKDDLTTAAIKDNLLDESFKYEDRPEIKTLGYARKLGELDLKRYKLGYIPTVSAIANYSMNGQGQKFFTNRNTIWIGSSYVGININVPIFNGFQRRYKMKQSQLNIQKLDNTVDNVKQAIDFEQLVTKESLKNALVDLDMQETNMQLAERVYNTTKTKFEQGLGSSFEILQADADLQTAQANYFNALYNAIITKISYQKSLGKLQ